jgi:hypothetical protein
MAAWQDDDIVEFGSAVEDMNLTLVSWRLIDRQLGRQVTRPFRRICVVADGETARR